MAASASDLLLEVGTPGTATTLSANYTIAATSITVASTANWPTTTGVVFAMDEAETVNGQEVQVAGTYREFIGTVATATSVTNVDCVYGTDRDFDAGATTRVYVPVSAERENRIVEWGLVSHKQDGTMIDSLPLTTPKVTTSINDTNGNELIKVTATASAVNELTVANAATTNAPSVSATGGDSNIDVRIVPKGTGNVKRGATGGSIDWWEEIGRTTLGTAGDTISVTSLPSRKHLQIIVTAIATGGTINARLRFNNDSGANYSERSSANGAADGTAVSQTSMGLSATASTADRIFTGVVRNVLAQEKLLIGTIIEQGTAGAANTTSRAELANKWANTASVISQVDIINTGTGDFAIGSECIVLGHD